jgi:hypothetical protein
MSTTLNCKLLGHYDCKEGSASSQSQPRIGASGGRSSQDGVEGAVDKI